MRFLGMWLSGGLDFKHIFQPTSFYDEASTGITLTYTGLQQQRIDL